MKRCIAALALLLPGVLAAQDVTKPGRNPSQPVDEEYTRKIHEYTTETFFLSPLVDYLPAAQGIPTPAATLGDIAGAPTKLPYTNEVHDYMRLLEKATPRVKVFSIGTSEEGREMIAVAVASDSLMAHLDENRARLAQLADPRTIGMDDARAARIAAQTTPVYYITGTIHSTEAGAPTALMELAYRLAVDESPYVKNIRDHVITLITPVVEVDGRDRVVDLYNWKVKNPGMTYPSALYWGHYVAHDNNRDAMGVTLKLTQNVLNTYVSWKSQVLHDLHESVAYLYDNTIGDGPYNSWLDPLLTNEWQMIGWNNVQEMTRFGMPGVFAHGGFDTWSPGYLMFIAATHNGISRLYETFGNGGTAETMERVLGRNDTDRTWFKQNPPLPRVQWSLRNNNNYEQTGLLVSLSYVAQNRQLLLKNFYEKSKRSVLKPTLEGPAAYVLPADDPRLGSQAQLLAVMQRQAVEIHRASAPFTVQVPVASRAGNGASGQGASAPRTEARSFPAGSYIIRMDQPYSRIADALLDYQYWAPDDPQKNPYDDTGWTFPEGFAVQAVRVTDNSVLSAPMTAVTGTIVPEGGVSGNGSVYAINHNADNALATLRYALPKADFQAAEEPFEAGGRSFARGSFLVSGLSRDELDRATRELGIQALALASAPAVETHPLRAARVAILHSWTTTQTEGWWRMAFDFERIPYDYINVQDVAANANLNAKYDVIIFPPSSNPQTIIDGMPMWRNPVPWKKTADTPNLGRLDETDDMRPGLGYGGLANLRSFVERGGVLITSTSTTDFAVQFGLAHGVSINRPSRGSVVGSLLRSRIVDDASPIVYGIPDSMAVFSDDGASFTVSNTAGGRGFGRGGGATAGRATGRGTAQDRDATPGFPALEERFQAPERPDVKPWQAGPVTDEMLRNPINVIPPDQRPRVALRFSGRSELLVSGLLSGGGDIAERPLVVDVPVKEGHVVLFSNNPMWRGETIGSYFMVFNTILNHDNLDAGRKLDDR